MAASVGPSKNFSLARAYEGAPELDASDEDKGQYVLARYGIQNAHYVGLYQRWAKALLFLDGKHWLTWDAKRVQFELDNDVPPWRQQPVTNYTYAIYRAAVSKLTKQRPKHEVIPPSGDSEDRESAKLGESVLDYLWRSLKQPKTLERAIGWILSTAQAYLEVDWDPEAGERRPQQVLVEVADEITGEPTNVPCACDDQGEPFRREPAKADDVALDGGKPYDLEASPKRVPIGDVRLQTVDPLCVRWNPEATNEEDAEEMYVARLWPRAKIEREFNVKWEDLQPDGGDEQDEEDGRRDFDEVMQSITASPPDPFNTQVQSFGTSQREGMTARGLVIKYYAKPCADYPDGRHWITVGAKKVWPPEGEAPLPFGFWPPLVPIVDTPFPGQPTGVALLGQVVPLNEQLNYLDGKIGEYHVMMAMGGCIWVSPEDALLEITTEPGQVKVSKGYGLKNKPPIREKLEALPASVYQERVVIESKLRTVAGMSDADLAQRPEGVTSGRGILALQEASDAPLMPTLTSIENALEEVGRRELVIVQQRYTEDRTIKIRGNKGGWEFRSFKGADLRDGLDVRVRVGSSFPWSKSAQWDTKLSLIQAVPQLVIKPDGSIDREQLARYLDAGPSGITAFESDEDPDLVEVEREISMFEAYDPSNPEGSNQLPQIAFWQNQPKRLEAFYNFLKRDYARFERWTPDAQIEFISYVQTIGQAVDELASAMAGAPLPPGEPGTQPGSAPPDASGGPPLQLVPPGGAAGQRAVPTARPGGVNAGAPRLTGADYRAAGQ